MSFQCAAPTSVVFGDGCVDGIGEQAAMYGSRALVLCGRSAMRRNGVLDRVVRCLKLTGLEVSVFEGVSPDPRSDEIDEAVGWARRDAVNLLVGLGGGSALDAAKATGVAVNGPLSGSWSVGR